MNSQKRILLVGDIMLDRTIEGAVRRMSPDAPVPVLSDTRETNALGGAGNVFAKLQAPGVQAQLFAIIGRDEAGDEIERLCHDLGNDDVNLLRVEDRPSIVKSRYIGNNTHLLRVDQEIARDITPMDEDIFIRKIETALETADLLILSDYAKGALTKTVLRQSIEKANELAIPVIVDPKGSDYSRYRGASVITPNRKELAEAVGKPVKSDEDIISAARKLISDFGIKAILATRSEDGMSLVTDSDVHHFPAEARLVRAVSGAGDTVIATLAQEIAKGETLPQAAGLANTAAARMVEQGTGSVAQKTASHLPGNWQMAVNQVRHWQSIGLKIGFTNGCFDILHAGHVNYLNETREFCDRLIVGLNHDRSVQILKGPTRPVNAEQDRKTVLENLKAVDLVVLFGAEQAGEDNTPCALIEELKPDIFFKGGDYKIEQLPEAEIVGSYGGEVKIMGLTAGKSTTAIITKIKD